MRTLPGKVRQDGTDDPTNPIDIGVAGWRATLKRTSQKIVRDRVSMSAGSLAYHWFLALFPAVIAILGFLALIRASTHFVTRITHAVEKGTSSGRRHGVHRSRQSSDDSRIRLRGGGHYRGERGGLERIRWNVGASTGT